MADATNPVRGRTIGEHGVIGNLETVAMVATDGTIDFLCWPNLDSPTVFAALLDPELGGEFEIRPQSPNMRAAQSYIPDTNVLLTRWISENGVAELADFMPHPEVTPNNRIIIRRLRITRGTVRIGIRCRPRMGYGRDTPTVHLDADAVIFATETQRFRLTGLAGWTLGQGSAILEIELACGEEIQLIFGDANDMAPAVEDIPSLQEDTMRKWRQWTRKSSYRGRWREQVDRSALALKLLTSHRHGSIAAAATFGLPEAIGGQRNWDYRATWIRDASFTVYAFLRLGHRDEAERFRTWVGERAQSAEDLRIMYALDGSDAAEERELDHLEGYGRSRPLRIGNAAQNQSQLDIFGEAIDALYLLNKHGTASSREEWKGVCGAVDIVMSRWMEPDAGIWEFRDRKRHLLHSRLMCWVAIDRAIRLATKRSFPATLGEWAQARDAIANDIWTNFRHPDYGWFVQEKGGRTLDAAALMMPLVRFVSATDPVWLATLDAIGEQLTIDGMVWRYRHEDGLVGGEGAFTTCMFWYVECLARAGRLDTAQHEMSKALSYANHLGLYSEELDIGGVQIGNFPQALTHLSFISAAYFLDRELQEPRSGLWQP